MANPDQLPALKKPTGVVGPGRRSSVIAKELRSRILSGQWKPRERVPTEFTLAKEFQVARATIVRSLREMEQEGLVWCRRGDGRFVVEPSQRRRTATIGVVVHDITLLNYPTTARYLSGIHSACLNSDYHVQIFGFNPHVKLHGMDYVIDQLDSSRVDGIVLMTWLLPESRVVELSHRIPVVSMSRVPTSPRIATVSGDTTGGTFDAACHLLDLGHRDVALVTIAADTLQGWQQREGVRMASRRLIEQGHGRCHIIGSARSNLSDTWLDEFRDLIRADPGPTAVIFGSEELATNGLKVIAAERLRIPQDISVISGNDDRVPPLVPVPLTSMNFDLAAIGRQAVSTLVDVMMHPTSHHEPKFVPGQLIVRDSTSPPPARR